MRLKRNNAVFRLRANTKRAVFWGLAVLIVSLVGFASIVQNLHTEKSYAVGTDCNPDAMTIDDAVCLQDMNYYVKQTMIIDTQYKLVDSRDQQIYKIAKLVDGNVWFLDNLKIGAEDEMLLTNNDTNTDPNVNGGEFVLPASAAGGNTYTAPVIYVGNVDNAVGSENGWMIGGYYNYCAASAGTYCDEDEEAEGDAMYDICPAGWRMPTGGVGGEYEAVTSAYSNAINVLQLPLSGRYYDGAPGRIGEDGYFWSSTNRDGRRMYYLNRSGSSLSPTGSYRRDRGYSMRCVAKDVRPTMSCNSSAKTIDEAVCMQDMNAMVKDSMAMDEAYWLIDIRDKEAYRVSKLQDGNIWMLDNLRLGGEETLMLTSDDTNTDPGLNNGEFLLPASGGWEDTYVDAQINASEKDTIQDSSNDWRVGNYYNYCAASAGTYCESDGEGDAEYDICPSNWRMPTGGNGGEYQTIANLYGDIADTLKLPLSGRYYSGASGRIGNDGYFWSSTNRDNLRMYYLNRAGSSISPTGSYRRDRGYSMRCVVGIKETGSGEFEWKNDKNDFIKGDDGDLVLIIDLSPAAVLSVKVNDVELEAGDYDLLDEDGATMIVLGQSYLNELPVGNYQLSVLYESGAVIETDFGVSEKTVEPEDEEDEEPESEDEIVVPDTGIETQDGSGGKKTDTIVSAIMVGILVSIVSGIVLIGRYNDRRR